MLFPISLYASLIIFVLGLIIKISTWFTKKIGPDSKNLSSFKRIISALKGILSVIFNKKIIVLIKIFFLDILLQSQQSYLLIYHQLQLSLCLDSYHQLLLVYIYL